MDNEKGLNVIISAIIIAVIIISFFPAITKPIPSYNINHELFTIKSSFPRNYNNCVKNLKYITNDFASHNILFNDANDGFYAIRKDSSFFIYCDKKDNKLIYSQETSK